MLEVAAERLPEAELVRADALPLPFPDGSFGRVFTSHFYGHLEPDERRRFVAEARRVATELVVVDSALPHPPATTALTTRRPVRCHPCTARRGC